MRYYEATRRNMLRQAKRMVIRLKLDVCVYVCMYETLSNLKIWPINESHLLNLCSYTQSMFTILFFFSQIEREIHHDWLLSIHTQIHSHSVANFKRLEFQTNKQKIVEYITTILIEKWYRKSYIDSGSSTISHRFRVDGLIITSSQELGRFPLI